MNEKSHGFLCFKPGRSGGDVGFGAIEMTGPGPKR